MIVSFEKIEEISSENIRFFTVRFDENELTQFELFLNKEFSADPHKKELEILFSSLKEMKTRGAKKFYFIEEQAANYMPVVSTGMKDKNKKDWGIRLYCIRLRDDLVILLNGDVKTSHNPLECPNVEKHFKNALKIAKKLDQSLISREIDYNDDNPFLSFTIEI